MFREGLPPGEISCAVVSRVYARILTGTLVCERGGTWLGNPAYLGCSPMILVTAKARWVWGCGSGAAGCGGIEVLMRLFQVVGRISEPRRDRATASVSPAQSRPTVSTTMSGRLPVLSP